MRFGSVEISTSPEGGWCAFDQFDYLPTQASVFSAFAAEVTGGGEFAVTAEGALSLRAPAFGDQVRLRSRARYDLSSGAIVIALKDAAALPSGNAVIEFQHSSGDRFGFWIFVDQLRSYTINRNELAFNLTAYDPTLHRFLRVSEAEPGLLFETSADGIDWANLGPNKPEPMPIAFPVTALEIHLRADGVDEADPQEIRLSIARIQGQSAP